MSFFHIVFALVTNTGEPAVAQRERKTKMQLLVTHRPITVQFNYIVSNVPRNPAWGRTVWPHFVTVPGQCCLRGLGDGYWYSNLGQGKGKKASTAEVLKVLPWECSRTTGAWRATDNKPIETDRETDRWRKRDAERATNKPQKTGPFGGNLSKATNPILTTTRCNYC